MIEMKKNKTLFRTIVFALIVLLIMLVSYGIYSLEFIRYPSANEQLDDFLKDNRQICCIQNIVVNDRAYTLVIGRIPSGSLLLLPSGPPAYIFDERKILLDMSRDIGDNPSFIKKWGEFKHHEFHY